MTYDSVLEHQVKPAGRWQIAIFILFYIPNSIITINIVRLPNIGPSHVCSSPWLLRQQWNYSQILDLSTSVQRAVNDSESVDFACVRYPTSLYRSVIENGTDVSPDLTISHERCQPGEWVYDETTAPFRHSLIQSFDLVCDRKLLIPLTAVMKVIGSFLGLIFSGVLADVYGRKTVTCILAPINALLLGFLYFCNSYWLLLAMFFFIGIVSPVAYYVGYVLCTELTTARVRTTFLTIDGVWRKTVADGVIIALAYLTQSWRWMCVGIGVMCATSFSYICLLPESPKWLIAKGRHDEALDILRKAIVRNGDTPARREMASQLTLADIGVSSSDQETGEERGGSSTFIKEVRKVGIAYRDFLVDPKCYRLWIPLSVVWGSLGMAYFSMPFYAVRLKGDPYLIALVTIVMPLPSFLLQWLLYRYFDRKRPVIALLSSASVMCLLGFVISLFHPHHVSITVIVTVVIAVTSCLYPMIQLYSSELFPTLHRSNALGFLSGIGYFGSGLGLYIERLDVIVWRCLPLLLYGVCLLASVVCTAMVPQVTESDSEDMESERQHALVETNENEEAV